MIITNTYAALLDLRRQLQALAQTTQETEKPIGLFACRFNSGAFGVPWEDTRRLVEGVGLKMTIMYTEEADVRGNRYRVNKY